LLTRLWPLEEDVREDDSVVRFAAQAWPLRAAEEDRSQAIFQEAGALAREVGLGEALATRLDHAARDEGEHRALCMHVGKAMRARAPRLDRSPVRARLRSLPGAPRQRLLSVLVVDVAVGESVSCGLFAAALDRTEDSLIRSALTTLLRDEAGHALLGWDCLAAALEGAPDEAKAWAREEAGRGLAALQQSMARSALRRAETVEPFDERLGAFGVLSPEARMQTFHDAVEKRVLPRLDALGVGNW
jgi:hypothetical protein